jgi:type II secretory pathway component PulM
MKRFTQLPNETQKVAAGLLAVLLIAGGAGLSFTMHGRVAAAKLRLEESRVNQQAMTELVRRFESRQLSGAAADLSAVVTRSLQGKNFQPTLLQQQNGELALRFDNAPFAEVLEWLIELEEAGAVVANVAVAQGAQARSGGGESSGVTLTLVLRGG